MEGAAIAQTCFLFDTPAVVIRSLSDLANEHSPMTFDQFLPIAAKHSCAVITQMLKMV
jgi:adenosylhomocysteine nucleosidase